MNTPLNTIQTEEHTHTAEENEHVQVNQILKLLSQKLKQMAVESGDTASKNSQSSTISLQPREEAVCNFARIPY